MDQKWMQCMVASGVFPTEYLVVIKDTDDSIYGEIYVDEDLVRVNPKPQDRDPEPIPGKVCVYVGSEKNGLVSVLLPVPTMDHGIYMQVPPSWLTD